MDSALIDELRGNFSAAGTASEHLMRCWSHQTCHRCLATSDCSWCPFTWSCVPNTNSIPFLAPLYDEKICPAKQERWELRSRPLGCDCSTATTISVIVSVAGTLLVVALAFLTILVAIRIRRYTVERGSWGMSSSGGSFWRRASSSAGGAERDPLLGQREVEGARSRRRRDNS